MREPANCTYVFPDNRGKPNLVVLREDILKIRSALFAAKSRATASRQKYLTKPKSTVCRISTGVSLCASISVEYNNEIIIKLTGEKDSPSNLQTSDGAWQSIQT